MNKDMEYIVAKTSKEEVAEELRKQCVRLAYFLEEDDNDEAIENAMVRLNLYERIYIAHTNMSQEILDVKTNNIMVNAVKTLRERDIKENITR